MNSSSSRPSLRWSRFFGFLQPVQIGVQLLLVAPGGAVDALQLRVLGVAAPIGAGDLGQLEGVADLGRGAKMRTAAQVVPVAMPVDRDILVRRNGSDELGFVRLADVLEVRRPPCRAARLRGGSGGPASTISCIFGFDLGQVFGREGLVAGEVVIEAVLDGRADGDLGAGNSACTAMAKIWAVSWRISSSASGSFLVMMWILASCSMGRNRSYSWPFTRMIRAALASPGPMAAAISAPCYPLGEGQGLAVGQGDGHLFWGSGHGGSPGLLRQLGRTLAPGAVSESRPRPQSPGKSLAPCDPLLQM